MLKVFLLFLVSFNLFAIEYPYSAGASALSNLPEFHSVLGDANSGAAVQSLGGNSNDACRTAHAIYDYAAYGGAVSSIGLGVYLPAKSIIRQSFTHTKTLGVSAGGGTIEFYCEDGGNIKAALAASSYVADGFLAGASDGAAANMKDDIAARCEIKAAIASAAVTAGYIDVYVDYCVHN